MPDRIRILFVDDEQNVLDGLVRLFRPQRQVWDMITASSGAQALEILARIPVTVVVSDMRMPGMDGTELLNRVQALRPETVRIILSGQSERESTIRRIGPGHHFLSKPCDPGRIAAVVERSCALRADLADPAIGRWVNDRSDLPSLPRTYHQIMDELRSSDPSLVRLAAIIEQDPGLTASLLHTVNSPMFGLDHAVSGIPEAVAMAGIETLRAMVLAIQVFNPGHRRDGRGLDIQGLWKHSVATARLARAIMKYEHGRTEDCEAAFTAGLLHDCGQVLLSTRDPDLYAEILDGVGPGHGICAAETSRLGIGHGRVGAWLLHHWDLPDAVVEAVAWHHDPARAGTDGLCPLAAVHIADSLLTDVPPTIRVTDAPLLERLGRANRLEAWRSLADQVQP